MDLPLRIVPDVNVLISGATLSHSAPSQVLQAWRTGEIEVATSEPILDDLKRVLQYPKVQQYFPLSTKQQVDFISELRDAAILVEGSEEVQISPDPDDDKLFACAIDANADYIVSGDKKDVLSVGEYRGIKTVSPADFVNQVLPLKTAA